MRLLIIEDSRRLRESLSDGLRSAGYAVDAVGEGKRGLVHAKTTEYDVIVLDLMLPGLDGLSVLRRFRERDGATPVLILSARDRVEQRIEGLRAGADDYMVKPFAFDELLARLEALCRRSRGVACNALEIRGVALDLGARSFGVAGVELALTPREYAVLEYLFMNAGRSVSRAELEEHVYAADRQVWSNAVDSTIAALRRKLARTGVAGLIVTRRGHGYLVPHPGEPVEGGA
jgi:DNA-binding response OmpR family regulator